MSATLALYEIPPISARGRVAEAPRSIPNTELLYDAAEREVALESSDDAGDGTTAAAVLTASIIKVGLSVQ
jgi:hypothetical protein